MSTGALVAFHATTPQPDLISGATASQNKLRRRVVSIVYKRLNIMAFQGWPDHSVSGKRKAATLHSSGKNKNRGAEKQRVMKTLLKNRRTYTENISSEGRVVVGDLVFLLFLFNFMFST